MCTAISYKTKCHYFGRNLDLERGYGECVVITPRNFPFTFRFAQSTDLKNWTLTPTECAFQRDRYAGGPAIYTLPGDPNYYVLYLEAYKADNKYGIEFRNCIARGTDLIHWEYSPINPVLDFEPEIDRQIANPYLTPAMQELIMKDNHTLGGNPYNAVRWVELAREEIGNI